MAGDMVLRIWDVEHGACSMLHHTLNGIAGRLAMIDSGDTSAWTPSRFIRQNMNRSMLDYLFVTNADQDHMSDLQGLWDAGVSVTTWHRNPTMGPEAFQAIKQRGGPLTRDARRYLQCLTDMNQGVPEPFENHMGGITVTTFYNSYPNFDTTNDLSMAVFIKYGSFKILFPGDLETAGWAALLARYDFQTELQGLDVLVASHHGRENGYCAEVFDFCQPRAVVMSDKAIVHDTQNMTQTYRNRIIANHPQGVFVQTTGKQRRVLTTRRDGWIQFVVRDDGSFDITTEYAG